MIFYLEGALANEEQGMHSNLVNSSKDKLGSHSKTDLRSLNEGVMDTSQRLTGCGSS